MIPSMFNLDHRLAELRPSEDELRLARQLREAADASARPSPHGREAEGAWRGAVRPAPGAWRVAAR